MSQQPGRRAEAEAAYREAIAAGDEHALAQRDDAGEQANNS